MSLVRGRVIKAADTPLDARAPNSSSPREAILARRIPYALVDAHDEASRIRRDAETRADALLVEARAAATAIRQEAAHEARESELARVSADLLALRMTEEAKASRQIDRTIEIAVLLAERLVGEAIAIEPARVQALARGALEETRGARTMRVEACRHDVPALEAMFASLGEGIASVQSSDELARGSLVIHTELGRIDAHVAPQLERLAVALREALLREALLRRGTS